MLAAHRRDTFPVNIETIRVVVALVLNSESRRSLERMLEQRVLDHSLKENMNAFDFVTKDAIPDEARLGVKGYLRARDLLVDVASRSKAQH